MHEGMDPNNQLVALADTAELWRESLSSLTQPELYFRSTWELEGDVNNGGFCQYFYNSSGDTAFIVLEALDAIDAHQCAAIVKRALSVFPSGLVPQDRGHREILLDRLPEAVLEPLEGLDQEFFVYPDNLTVLLHRYVTENRHLIRCAHEVGI